MPGTILGARSVAQWALWGLQVERILIRRSDLRRRLPRAVGSPQRYLAAPYRPGQPLLYRAGIRMVKRAPDDAAAS